ncbi:MAG: nitrilase-related carbon-nitrogen hydrolase [bacterium]
MRRRPLDSSPPSRQNAGCLPVAHVPRCLRQLCCTTDIERNLDTAERLIRRAARLGASLIATPENTAFLGPQFHKVSTAEPLDGPTLTRLGELAGSPPAGGLRRRAASAARWQHRHPALP